MSKKVEQLIAKNPLFKGLLTRLGGLEEDGSFNEHTNSAFTDLYENFDDTFLEEFDFKDIENWSDRVKAREDLAKSIIDEYQFSIIKSWGGEGEGDSAGIVYKVGELYYRHDWGYTSDYGNHDDYFEADEHTRQVQPVERMVTFYE